MPPAKISASMTETFCSGKAKNPGRATLPITAMRREFSGTTRTSPSRKTSCGEFSFICDKSSEIDSPSRSTYVFVGEATELVPPARSSSAATFSPSKNGKTPGLPTAPTTKTFGFVFVVSGAKVCAETWLAGTVTRQSAVKSRNFFIALHRMPRTRHQRQPFTRLRRAKRSTLRARHPIVRTFAAIGSSRFALWRGSARKFRRR